MISQDRLEKALSYLAITDDETAQFKVDAERAKYKAKALYDAAVARLPGTVAERQGQAGEMREYKEAMDHHFSCLLEYEKRRNKRNTEELVVEVWRSEGARMRGNVT